MSGSYIASPDIPELLPEPVYFYSHDTLTGVITPGGTQLDFRDHFGVTSLKAVVDYLDGEIARGNIYFRRASAEEVANLRASTIPAVVREAELRAEIEAQIRAEYEAKLAAATAQQSPAPAFVTPDSTAIMRDPGAEEEEARIREEAAKHRKEQAIQAAWEAEQKRVAEEEAATKAANEAAGITPVPESDRKTLEDLARERAEKLGQSYEPPE